MQSRVYLTGLVWLAAGVLLVFDWFSDALTSTYLAILVNIAEAAIGIALLIALFSWIQFCTQGDLVLKMKPSRPS
jgi:NADH:ubiquinone oxidoreductase subunit K